MKQEFDAVIQAIPEKNGAYVEIPFDVETVYGAKRVKVKAAFDGVEYRGSIVKMGLPCYIIGMTKEIRSKIGKEAGDTVHVTVEKDEEIREVELPKELIEALADHQEAAAFFESLSFSGKRKYVQWIDGAKKAETREKRMKEAVKKLQDHIKL